MNWHSEEQHCERGGEDSADHGGLVLKVVLIIAAMSGISTQAVESRRRR
jgi:hypothetical protein